MSADLNRMPELLVSAEPLVREISVAAHYPNPQGIHLSVRGGEIELTPDEAEAWGRALLDVAARVRAEKWTQT